LLGKFRKCNRLKCRKLELEKKFFDYHFAEVCARLGETMEEFLFLNK
jgi:hypothetical protein